MLEIKCPHCGKRSQNEFSYGGDASVKRPQLGKEISDKKWDDFVYFRNNPIYHDILSGYTEARLLMGMPIEAKLNSIMKKKFPQTKRVILQAVEPIGFML